MSAGSVQPRDDGRALSGVVQRFSVVSSPRPPLPVRLALAVVRRGTWLSRSLLPTEAFESLRLFGSLGYWPRLRRPETLAEKLVWLKLHYEHPLHPVVSDKLAVREYAAERAPWMRSPRVLWVGDDPADIPFDELPDTAVLKSTHASGHVLYLTAAADRERVREVAGAWLGVVYGVDKNERQYMRVKPRLFVEEFIGTVDESGARKSPLDYKFLVMNGTAHAVQVFVDRSHHLTRRMFSKEWEPLPIGRHDLSLRRGGRRTSEAPIPRPAGLTQMIDAAERLAAPFPFARVDFYEVHGTVYLGEVTMMPAGGYMPIFPLAWDARLGALLELPQVGPFRPS
jgi:hypothetical protein